MYVYTGKGPSHWLNIFVRIVKKCFTIHSCSIYYRVSAARLQQLLVRYFVYISPSGLEWVEGTVSQDFSNTFCSLTHYVGPWLRRQIFPCPHIQWLRRVGILDFRLVVHTVCYPNFSNVNFTAIGVGIYVRKLINLAKLFYPFHKEGSKILRNCPFRKNNCLQNFDI